MPRTLAHIQNELLVIRCQDGEPDALEELIARWQPRLRGHAWHLTHDAHAAADVCQEAWIAIARGIRGLADPTSFAPWAFRIVTHKCADWTRAQQRRRKLVAHAAGESRTHADTTDREDEEITRLRERLATIDPARRAIISMHYLEQMNVNQIATALDIPVGTVKSRLYHARDELKRALERKTS